MPKRGKLWKNDKVIRGGCPCGFWSHGNCMYLQGTGICTAPRDIRPEYSPPEKA